MIMIVMVSALNKLTQQADKLLNMQRIVCADYCFL
jgi:hypothetical protein